MSSCFQYETEAIEVRAERMHALEQDMPWTSVPSRDRDVWRDRAELHLCQENALPSHRHYRGDHSLFGAFERWKEGSGAR